MGNSPSQPSVLLLAQGADKDTVVFEQVCRAADRPRLEQMAAELEAWRRTTGNFYHRVRAIFFLEALHRYFLPPHYPPDASGRIPFQGHQLCLERRFEEAIALFLEHQRTQGASDALSSALAAAYHGLAFRALAQHVQKTVRCVRGNQWMFRTGHPVDYPLRLRPELLAAGANGTMPVLGEETAVRLDLSHAAWSDIFFLGMDNPEGAKVLNFSIDLAVHGRDGAPRPPVAAFLRVIDEPVLRLTSVDLGATVDITTIDEVFDFAKDYLGLLKAAVIAAGIVPPGLEGSGHALSGILARLCGPGRGLEIASQVRDIPKGSRLAVSTNLLGCLIALAMRATGQTTHLFGGLSEEERRTVASRAILGEWLGGSGGGWQDSGGVWPGIKLIEGEVAEPGDTEYGTSRGRLLPRHTLFGLDAISAQTRRELQESLILVHGGMSQNVGPILEMVTEKYLLKLEREWAARREAQEILQGIVKALRSGDVRRVAELTTRNFFGPLQTIIPWASNAYTERLIAEIGAELGSAYRGFIMLGGMSGGGMGFWVDPAVRAKARTTILAIMRRTKAAFENALPFAMDPVIYDFEINEAGSTATLRTAPDAVFSPEYYLFMVPRWLRQDPRTLSSARRTEIDQFAARHLATDSAVPLVGPLMQRILPPPAEKSAAGTSLRDVLAANGFDPVQHERIRAALRSGRIGLAQNRLPMTTSIEDVHPGDVIALYDNAAALSPAATRQDEPAITLAKVDALSEARAATAGRPSGIPPLGPSGPPALRPSGTLELRAAAAEMGRRALSENRVAVVTLAAGSGSRWTQGAGTVKALHPFAKLAGRHRSFVETHLAKTRATAGAFGIPITHIFTTSHLTHAPMEALLKTSGALGSQPSALSSQPSSPAATRLDEPAIASVPCVALREAWVATAGSPSAPLEFRSSDPPAFRPSAPRVLLSPGRSIGLRLIPTVRDLRFAWEEMSHQQLDPQKQKMRESVHKALMEWAVAMGEGSDYTDNAPLQCLHPVGHWYEVANLLLNGTLRRLLAEQPQLEHLLLHNIDTLGASLDPAVLGRHILEGATLSFEVIRRRAEDRGGGLARVGGQLRLVEGLAMAREEDEFNLTFYNTATCWMTIDPLLALFGVDRTSLDDEVRITEGVRNLAAKMPAYITLKEVRKRWGNGQEDIFPVAQFEKLWGDVTTLPNVPVRYFAVPRARGQQLKDQAQLDAWLRDGSAAAIEKLCQF